MANVHEGDNVRVLPRAPGFQTDLIFHENGPGAEKPYTIVEDLVFSDGTITLVVPARFQYDRASIPRWLRWLLPRHMIDYAAAVHDYLYFLAYSKRVADALMFMIAHSRNQMPWWKIELAYQGVRLFGWKAWLGHWRRRRKV